MPEKTSTNLYKLSHKNSFIILNFYQKLAKKFGHTHRALGWASTKSQEKRYLKIIKTVKNWKNLSVLDVGCGFGDFYDYLQQYVALKNFSYLGIDYHREFIHEATLRYPGINVQNLDFLNYKKKHDIVIANGSFNVAMPDHKNYFLFALKKLKSLSKKQCVITCLSDQTNNKKEKTFYYFSKDELNHICQSLNLDVKIDTHKINDETVDYILDISF